MAHMNDKGGGNWDSALGKMRKGQGFIQDFWLLEGNFCFWKFEVMHYSILFPGRYTCVIRFGIMCIALPV